MANQWNQRTKTALDEVVEKTRKEACYAVFDWDNTSIFHDVGVAFFIRQLETLHFALTVNQFSAILFETLDLSSEGLAAHEADQFHKEMTHLIQNYQLLYERSETLGGTTPLAEVQQLPAYADFRIWMYRLYQQIGAVFSTQVSYPWVTYFLAGMTSNEVQDFSRQTIQQALKAPLNDQLWVSSDPSVGSIQVPSGLRIFPEMKELYQQLMARGIAVYICSASQEDIVIPFAQSYQIPASHVFGMRLAASENGVLTAKLAENYPVTQARGKVTLIQEKIAPKYGGRGPVIVGGDSSGDAAMLQAFPETEVALIIERETTGEIEALRELARQAGESASSRYYLQKRKNQTGEFYP